MINISMYITHRIVITIIAVAITTTTYTHTYSIVIVTIGVFITVIIIAIISGVYICSTGTAGIAAVKTGNTAVCGQ